MGCIKLLLVTNGVNSCAEYLKMRASIDLHILDFSQGHIVSKNGLERSILDISPDLLFVYRCPFIISKRAYSVAKMGAYNIHPSLLPKYRGLNPWDEIFKNKETENGVTLHRLTDVVDGGEIIYQQAYAISRSDTLESARNSADIIAAKLLAKFMDEYIPEHWDFINLYPLPNKFDYIKAIAENENFLIENEIRDRFVIDSDTEYYEGAYSVVFKVKTRDGELALRCWKCIDYDDCEALCCRMKSIKDYLQRVDLPYFLNYNFYEQGIVTGKGVYPVLVMDWKLLPDLKQYLRDNLDDGRKLVKLAANFVDMVADLHNANIAHGDLQVSNIKVDEGGNLLLIDYDTLYVPTLKNEKDRVKGNLCFQHHSRLGNEYLNPELDYFSEYIIYFGIMALAIYPQLYDFLNLDNNDFIFTREELSDLRRSRIGEFVVAQKNSELDVIFEGLLAAWRANCVNEITPLERWVATGDFGVKII